MSSIGSFSLLETAFQIAHAFKRRLTRSSSLNAGEERPCSMAGLVGDTLITTKTATDAFAGAAVLGQSSGYLSGPPACQ
jgi:hypothetical protein